MPLTQLVCASCGASGGIATEITTKEKTCVFCMGKTFKVVELPETLTCIYCKKEVKVEDILKKWTKIPFLDIMNNTYYCGCRGWD